MIFNDSLNSIDLNLIDPALLLIDSGEYQLHQQQQAVEEQDLQLQQFLELEEKKQQSNNNFNFNMVQPVNTNNKSNGYSLPIYNNQFINNNNNNLSKDLNLTSNYYNNINDNELIVPPHYSTNQDAYSTEADEDDDQDEEGGSTRRKNRKRAQPSTFNSNSNTNSKRRFTENNRRNRHGSRGPEDENYDDDEDEGSGRDNGFGIDTKSGSEESEVDELKESEEGEEEDIDADGTDEEKEEDEEEEEDDESATHYILQQIRDPEVQQFILENSVVHGYSSPSSSRIADILRTIQEEYEDNQAQLAIQTSSSIRRPRPQPSRSIVNSIASYQNNQGSSSNYRPRDSGWQTRSSTGGSRARDIRQMRNEGYLKMNSNQGSSSSYNNYNNYSINTDYAGLGASNTGFANTYLSNSSGRAGSSSHAWMSHFSDSHNPSGSTSSSSSSSSEEIEKLKKEIDDLQSKKCDLEQRNFKLQTDYKDLLTTHTSLKTSIVASSSPPSTTTTSAPVAPPSSLISHTLRSQFLPPDRKDSETEQIWLYDSNAKVFQEYLNEIGFNPTINQGKEEVKVEKIVLKSMIHLLITYALDKFDKTGKSNPYPPPPPPPPLPSSTTTSTPSSKAIPIIVPSSASSKSAIPATPSRLPLIPRQASSSSALAPPKTLSEPLSFPTTNNYSTSSSNNSFTGINGHRAGHDLPPHIAHTSKQKLARSTDRNYSNSNGIGNSPLGQKGNLVNGFDSNGINYDVDMQEDGENERFIVPSSSSHSTGTSNYIPTAHSTTATFIGKSKSAQSQSQPLTSNSSISTGWAPPRAAPSVTFPTTKHGDTISAPTQEELAIQGLVGLQDGVLLPAELSATVSTIATDSNAIPIVNANTSATTSNGAMSVIDQQEKMAAFKLIAQKKEEEEVLAAILLVENFEKKQQLEQEDREREARQNGGETGEDFWDGINGGATSFHSIEYARSKRIAEEEDRLYAKKLSEQDQMELEEDVMLGWEEDRLKAEQQSLEDYNRNEDADDMNYSYDSEVGIDVLGLDQNGNLDIGGGGGGGFSSEGGFH